MVNKNNKLGSKHTNFAVFFDVLRWMGEESRYITIKDLCESGVADIKPKTAERILKGLYEYFTDENGDGYILKTKIGREIAYKVRDDKNVVLEVLNKSDDISWIISNLNNYNPQLFNDLSRDMENEINSVIRQNEDIFLFKNSLIEDLNEEIFSKIKKAIKERKWQKITFKNGEGVLVYKDNQKEFVKGKIVAKPLKLIFVDNNWYLAIEDEEGRFGLVRLSFIKSLEDDLFKKSYQKKVLTKYKSYFKKLQNSMTLYGADTKVAKLRADKNIKKYFKKSMKKFFPSQKFIEENEDGIIFEVTYTQPLEILPFIKRWLPSMEILEPQELKDELKKDLEIALKKIGD
jgi:predicted DNA-binding transcriptional regulator YafY